MIAIDKPNPFVILGLRSSAPTREIVAHGQLLTDLAETSEQRQLYQWAIQQLINEKRPLERLEYELFEAPGAEYDDETWTDFRDHHRRLPIDLASIAQGVAPPGPGDFDLGVLLRLCLEGLLAVPTVDMRPAYEDPPVDPGPGSPSLEVHDVLFG